MLINLQQILADNTPIDLVSQDFVIAGWQLRLVGQSAWLAAFGLALNHARVLDTQPDLIVHLRGHRPNLEQLDTQTVRWLEPDNQDSIQLLDLTTGVGLCVCAIPLRTYQQCAPLLHMLQAFLETKNMTLVHAAAVALRGKAALLVGRGGSGKSTTALLCLKHGLDYLGDDYCAVQTEPKAKVFGVYSSAKFHAAERLGFMTARQNPDLEKHFAMLSSTYHLQLPLQASIQAVFLPTLADELQIKEITAQTALLSLAPSTMFQLKTGPMVFSWLGRLVQKVPCYRLSLGQNPDHIAPLLQGFLEGLSS